MHHDTAMSPSSAASFATPALSHDGSVVSLSSEQDSPATLPAQFSPTASPIYMHGASPVQGDYFGPTTSTTSGLGGAGAGPSVGLGFGALAAAEGKGKEREATPAAAAPAGPAPAMPEPERKRQTAKPAETRRRGEDMGLTLGDFDMLDTLGYASLSLRLSVLPSRRRHPLTMRG